MSADYYQMPMIIGFKGIDATRRRPAPSSSIPSRESSRRA